MGALYCFSCNSKNEFSERVGFRDTCESCSADLHVCKNCEFYDPSSYNECREPNADRVVEKERANYCDYFQATSSKGSGEDNKKDLLSAAEALFKK